MVFVYSDLDKNDNEYESDNEDNEGDEDPEELEEKRNESLNQEFKNLSKNALMKCGCVLYFTIGLALSVATVGQELDPNQGHELGYLKLFIILLIICYIINILLIMYNRYSNTEKLTRNPNNIVLYGFAMPLLTTCILYLILRIVRLYMFSTGTGNSTLALTFFYLLFLISVVILFFDENRMRISTKPNHNQHLRKASILITIVGIFVSIILHLTRQELSIFKEYSGAYYNVTYYSNKMVPFFQNETFFKIEKKIEEILFPIHIAFLVVCFISLLESFFGSFNFNDGGVTGSNRKWMNTFSDMLLGIVIIILSICIIPLVYDKEKNTLHYGASYLLQCLIYSFGMILSVIQIKEIKHWPKSNQYHNGILNKSLLLIGCFGQIIFILNYSSLAIDDLFRIIGSSSPGSPNPDYSVVSQCLLLASLLFLIAQVALQNIVVHVALSRIPRIPPLGSAVRNYCPSVGLLCLNVGSIFMILYVSNCSMIGEFKLISNNIFYKGLHMIAVSFSLIYRIHGCKFFIVMLNKVHN